MVKVGIITNEKFRFCMRVGIIGIYFSSEIRHGGWFLICERVFGNSCDVRLQ